MSELLRIRDVCLNCRAATEAERKRAYRKEFFAIVSEAETETNMRIDDGVVPYSQLQVAMALSDRLRMMCTRCESQLMSALASAVQVSTAWQEIEIKILEPFERQLAEDAKAAALAEARRLRRKGARAEGKLIKFNFRPKKKQSQS